MELLKCSGGFLVKKNKFLFGKRSKKKSWAPNVWDIAGGKALPGELPLDTLKREMFEETGIIVLHATLLSFVDVWDGAANNYFKYHIYMITSWKGKAVNCSKEHTKIRWFKREKLNKVEIALKSYLTLIDHWLDGEVLQTPL